MKIKISRKSLITLVLTMFWVIMTILYIKREEFGLLTLDDRHQIGDLNFSRVYEMLAGDFISGEFRSKYPNLGTIGVRFNTFGRINDDILVFRIKEKGNEKWYYEGDYKTDQFQSGRLFPFGFPLINDSAGKTYLFEIESLRGAPGNAIVLNGTFPPMTARHVYSKSELGGSISIASYFLTRKLANLLTDQGTILNSLVYAIPLMYYVVLSTFNYSLVVSSLVIVLSFATYILAGSNTYQLIPVSMLFAWTMIVFRHRIDSQVSSYFGLLSLAVFPFFLIFGLTPLAENTAVAAFLFFFFSGVQRAYYLDKKMTKRIDLRHFQRHLYYEWKNSLMFVYLIATGVITIAIESINGEKFSSKKNRNDQIVLLTERFRKPTVIITLSLLLWGIQRAFTKSKGFFGTTDFWRLLFIEWGSSLLFLTAAVFVLISVIIIKRKLIDSMSDRTGMIALVAYRYGKPMAKTYLVTTRLVAYAVIAIVRLLKWGYRYGPYLVMMWLLWSLFAAVKGYVFFYDDFYIRDQRNIFWDQLGRYLSMLYLFGLLVFMIFQRKKSTRNKTYLLSIIVVICLFLSGIGFGKQTWYKYETKIWSIRPNNTSEPWVDITITGRNFRNMPFRGAIKIDGVSQRIIKWDDREITFRTDPYFTRSGNLTVNPLNSKPSDGAEFEYYGNR